MAHIEAREKMLRAVYLIGQVGPGGSERQLLILLKNLGAVNVQAGLIVWSRSLDDALLEDFRSLQIPLLELEAGESIFIKFLKSLAFIKQFRPHVIHSYSFFLNFVAWPLALWPKALAVGSVRSDYHVEIRESGWIRGFLCLKFPKDLIFNNAPAFNLAKEACWWLKPRQMHLIPNAVLEPEEYRSQTLDQQKLRVLGVGRLYPEKRWAWFLDVLKSLEATNTSLNWEVRILGEGPLRAELESLIVNMSLQHRVSLPGYTSQVSRELAEASILVLCSSYEGSPNVVLEAMAHGIPIVSTKVGDLSDIVENGKSGFLIDISDKEGFVRHLDLLLRDAKLREFMGVEGKRRVLMYRGLNRLLEGVLKVYREV